MIKKVTIREGNIGLVFQNGSFVETLDAGTHWIIGRKAVYVYNMLNEFIAPIKLDILLNNKALQNKLEIITVLDNEIVLKYENNIFKGVLAAGRYAFWKSEFNNFTFQKINLSNTSITENIDKAVLSRVELASYIRIFTIESYEKGILYIDGHQVDILKSGTYYFWKNATKIAVEKADLRQQQLELSGQEILTKDKTALRVNFYAQYRVVDINKALSENKNFEKQLYILIQLALREYIGAVTLDELLENKDSIAEKVVKTIASKANKLGVQVADSGIRDIILPGDIKDIMNQVLIAQKKAQANVIMRREETASTRSLLNTAKLMEDNNMLFKLKEMEYVEKIAGKIGEISVSGNGNIVEQLKTIFSK